MGSLKRARSRFILPGREISIQISLIQASRARQGVLGHPDLGQPSSMGQRAGHSHSLKIADLMEFFFEKQKGTFLVPIFVSLSHKHAQTPTHTHPHTHTHTHTHTLSLSFLPFSLSFFLCLCGNSFIV